MASSDKARTRRQERAGASDDPAERHARSWANRRIAWLCHAIVYAIGIALLWFVAGPTTGIIVALAWGIGLSMHGFWAVIAPELRQRWMREEAERFRARSGLARRDQGGRHAKSLEQLSASIAHEVRNPITAAKSLVQQIAEDPAATENEEYACIAVEELDRVERAISHLLRYAREEELRPSDVDLDVVVDSALETLAERLTRSEATIERRRGVTSATRADSEKLRRVVINLVSNALDALEESATEAPAITIASGHDLTGEHTWLSVRDNGPGVSDERQARVFDPFYTSRDQGTGLGLAISRKIAEVHGGTLEMKESRPGWTELVLTLPHGGAEAWS